MCQPNLNVENTSQEILNASREAIGDLPLPTDNAETEEHLNFPNHSESLLSVRYLQNPTDHAYAAEPNGEEFNIGYISNSVYDIRIPETRLHASSNEYLASNSSTTNQERHRRRRRRRWSRSRRNLQRRQDHRSTYRKLKSLYKLLRKTVKNVQRIKSLMNQQAELVQTLKSLTNFMVSERQNNI